MMVYANFTLDIRQNLCIKTYMKTNLARSK